MNVYPETIKIALLHPRLVHLVTGSQQAHDVVAVVTLILRSHDEHAEYAKLHTAIGNDAVPRIVLAATNDAVHFGDGVKQRWKAKVNT